jgi:hypothetical protein
MGGRLRKALMKIRIGPLEGQSPLLTLLTNLGKLLLELMHKILGYLPMAHGLNSRNPVLQKQIS